MFASNFYTSCFVSRENSIGKRLIRHNWEKAVYRSLFTLANTLTIRPKLPIWPKQGFFGKSHLTGFYFLIAPYHAAKFEKILRADPEKFYKVQKFTDLETNTQANQQQVYQLNNALKQDMNKSNKAISCQRKELQKNERR